MASCAGRPKFLKGLSVDSRYVKEGCKKIRQMSDDTNVQNQLETGIEQCLPRDSLPRWSWSGPLWPVLPADHFSRRFNAGRDFRVTRWRCRERTLAGPGVIGQAESCIEFCKVSHHSLPSHDLFFCFIVFAMFSGLVTWPAPSW
jgi:hypothetical protein